MICQIQSEAMALDAAAKGADIIVAQGTEAGGHGISRSAFTLVPPLLMPFNQRFLSCRREGSRMGAVLPPHSCSARTVLCSAHAFTRAPKLRS